MERFLLISEVASKWGVTDSDVFAICRSAKVHMTTYAYALADGHMCDLRPEQVRHAELVAFAEIGRRRRRATRRAIEQSQLRLDI